MPIIDVREQKRNKSHKWTTDDLVLKKKRLEAININYWRHGPCSTADDLPQQWSSVVELDSQSSDQAKLPE